MDPREPPARGVAAPGGVGSVHVLMYHSISDAPGPTNIPGATFRGHLDALQDCGYEVLPLTRLASWLEGGPPPPARSCVITFDDGFTDFAEQAAPALAAKGWTATVFLPSGLIGGRESWAGADAHTRRALLGWDQVGELSAEGFGFGAHSVTHLDLTTLGARELEYEIRQSREDVSRHTGQAPACFAPPYGRANPEVLAEIRRWYRLSVGTRLDRVDRHTDRYDVPRIEMHYFRDQGRWRRYLEGRAEGYFRARRILRAIRGFSVGGWRAVRRG